MLNLPCSTATVINQLIYQINNIHLLVVNKCNRSLSPTNLSLTKHYLVHDKNDDSRRVSQISWTQSSPVTSCSCNRLHHSRYCGSAGGMHSADWQRWHCIANKTQQ